MGMDIRLGIRIDICVNICMEIEYFSIGSQDGYNFFDVTAGGTIF